MSNTQEGIGKVAAAYQAKRSAEELISAATFSLKEANKIYTETKVQSVTDELMRWQREEGKLDRRTIEVYLRNFASDVRDIYTSR